MQVALLPKAPRRLRRLFLALISIGIGFASVFFLTSAIPSALAQVSKTLTISPGLKSAVDGNAAFALDLYQQLKERPGNLFFSPYSISTALAMTYAGARGHTAYEMAEVLHFGLPQERLHPAFGALARHMKQIQRPNRTTLLIANSLWCQHGYHFTDAFLSVVRANYQAEARQVDFIHAASAASDEINQWVMNKTMGNIKELVPPGELDQETRLVLCNAIYFKGTWQHQFEVGDTKPANFYVNTNRTVIVPMMSQKTDFRTTWCEDKSVELLELPYSGNDLSMIILLPMRGWIGRGVEQRNLSELEAKLTLANLRAWLAKLDRIPPEEVWVRLPRFTMTQKYDLKPALKSMGMPSAFDAGTANFSGMDGTTDLYISDVLHKAFVRVDEAGTEAAAATAVPMTLGMPELFIVNHPFVFLIRDNASGLILFIGRVVDPTN